MAEDQQNTSPIDKEEEFKQRLVSLGLLRPRRRPKSVKRERHPIKVIGKPLSEMIIEDRR